MKFYRHLFLLLCIAFYGLIACNAPQCETTGVFVNCGFYHYDGINLKDTLFNSLNIYLENDLMTPWLESNGGKTGSVQLPLSMLDNHSKFIFRFDSINTDTLVFHYSQSLHLVSHECGFINFFEISHLETTTNCLDSVWIRKTLVEYGPEENIKIYF